MAIRLEIRAFVTALVFTLTPSIGFFYQFYMNFGIPYIPTLALIILILLTDLFLILDNRKYTIIFLCILLIVIITAVINILVIGDINLVLRSLLYQLFLLRFTTFADQPKYVERCIQYSILMMFVWLCYAFFYIAFFGFDELFKFYEILANLVGMNLAEYVGAMYAKDIFRFTIPGLNSNTLIYLLFPLIYYCYNCFLGIHKAKRYIYLFIITFFSIAIFLTLSRQGIVILCLGFLVDAFLFRKVKMKIFMILLLLMFVYFIFLYFPVVMYRLLSIFSDSYNDYSSSNRLGSIKTSISLIDQNIFGLGASSYNLATVGISGEHNFLLSTWIHQGLQGLMLFLLFLFIVVAGYFTNWHLRENIFYKTGIINLMCVGLGLMLSPHLGTTYIQLALCSMLLINSRKNLE